MDLCRCSNILIGMSELDVAKETIAYLKFWMSVLVVSNISLVGYSLKLL